MIKKSRLAVRLADFHTSVVCEVDQRKGRNLKLYPLFLTMATVTVLTPGPGVVMTLTNTLRHGLRRSIGGIFGIAFGALVVAALSATGVGVVLSTSAVAFNALKLLGAAYLVYLGIKLWHSTGLHFMAQDRGNTGFAALFVEGLSLQMTNPKAIFFFLSVLPQFIDPAVNYTSQFAALVLTYSSLVVVIHCIYGFAARRAKRWLTTERGARLVSRVGAVVFLIFGAGLASAS